MKYIFHAGGLLISLILMGCSSVKVPNQKGLIGINGTDLYVESVGEGEPIIVIHGGPVLDHGYLQPHLQGLEDNYRLIYFDQRLSGRSSGDVDSAGIAIDAFIGDIDAIREHFGYEKVHVLGHSWGGLLAMEYAIRHSAHVKNLLLINSMPPSYSLWQKEQNILASRVSPRDSVQRQKIIQSELFKQDPPAAIRQLLRLSFKGQLEDTALVDRLDFYIPDDYMSRSQKFSLMGDYLFQYDLTGQLEKLKTSTLIVYGENEPSAEISAPVLERKIQNSKLVIMDDCGHFPFLEHPDKFTQEVVGFLDSNR